LIENGDIWLDMVKSRTKTAHTYNEETANEIANAITNSYFNLFLTLKDTLEYGIQE